MNLQIAGLREELSREQEAHSKRATEADSLFTAHADSQAQVWHLCRSKALFVIVLDGKVGLNGSPPGKPIKLSGWAFAFTPTWNNS